MNSLFFYIGLGAGLAVAAGLRPFLPALLAGGLGSGDVLGVDFEHGSYTFLSAGWWLVLMAALFAATWLIQLRVGSERFDAGPLGAATAGIGIGVGALLFAGTLSDHGRPGWPGLIAGVACAAPAAAAVLKAIMQRGVYVDDCVAAFPSVTPVCAGSIATGTWQDEHLIPSMNWYSREESRYVEYGSSFRAAQRFGFARQLTDTVYNMNRAHLSGDVRTVFELLDDAEVR